MTEKKFILNTNDDKAYFYFGEKLIFQSSKSMPFIVLKKNKNGIETSVGLSDIKLITTEDGYEIEFCGRDKKATVEIKVENKKATVEIKTDEEFDEMCFTLYAEDGRKVYGLPSYKQKIKKRTLREKIFNIKPDVIKPELKLSFFINDFYFFKNINVADYKIEIKDNIYIKTPQKNIKFSVVFEKNIYAAVLREKEDCKKIKKYPSGALFVKIDNFDNEKIEEFSKKIGEKPCGVIIKDRLFDYGKIKTDVVKGEKNNLDVVFCIGKTINETFAKKYFEEKYYEKIGENKCLVKLDTSEQIRKYLIIVRKYLDIGASGIYFDGNFTKKEILYLKDGMKTVVKEYISCAVFHSTVNESIEDFGYYIIKDEKVIKNYDILSKYYLYSGEFLVGKEEKSGKKDKKFSINILEI